MENFKWHAFLSHASEDKEEIAIPLTEALPLQELFTYAKEASGFQEQTGYTGCTSLAICN